MKLRRCVVFADAESESCQLGPRERIQAQAQMTPAAVQDEEQGALGALFDWKSPDER